MKLLLQRVTKADCKIENKVISEINNGILAFLCVEKDDTVKSAQFLAHKCANLRIFEDINGKMNLSVKEVGGSILIISQFTLCANTNQGLRPGFDGAATPEQAKEIYKKFIEYLNAEKVHTKEGAFGQHMEVGLINSGPATFMLLSR